MGSVATAETREGQDEKPPSVTLSPESSAALLPLTGITAPGCLQYVPGALLASFSTDLAPEAVAAPGVVSQGSQLACSVLLAPLISWTLLSQVASRLVIWRGGHSVQATNPWPGLPLNFPLNGCPTPSSTQVTFPESLQMRAKSVYFLRFQKNMPFFPS